MRCTLSSFLFGVHKDFVVVLLLSANVLLFEGYVKKANDIGVIGVNKWMTIKLLYIPYP